MLDLIRDLVIGICAGLITGVITSYFVTRHFKEKEEEEIKKRKKTEQEELTRKQIQEDYLDLKRYLHEMRTYIFNAYMIWDKVYDNKEDNVKVIENLKVLLRYLKSRPYNVILDLEFIKFDKDSQKQLEEMDNGIQDFIDNIHNNLGENVQPDISNLLNNILLLTISMQKINKVRIHNDTVAISLV